MAIWQYLLIVVPENSIDNNYQCIFKNNTTKYLPKTKSFWKEFEGNPVSIISEIDQIIPRADWGDETYICWKGNANNNEDNDASISLSDDKTKIEEFQFRIDLRKVSNITHVFQSILNLCEANHLVLIDLKGEIFKPKLADILKSMKTSNANAFLTDPINFLDSLKDNIE